MAFPIDWERALELVRARAFSITPKNLELVSAEVGEDAARWAFTQWELRFRARAKFALADQMLFVREALEQATHEEVARWHASRFPAGVLVVDATVGIGADAIALAARGPVVGYEIDPERLACAVHNLAVHGLSADLRLVSCLSEVWATDYAFADPARRVAGRRTLELAEFEPDPVGLCARFRELTLVAMKLSPMLPDSALSSLGTRVEFVSFDGECREALVWAGSEASPGRFACQVETDLVLPGSASNATGVAETLAFFTEADPAAIRAHALPSLCEQTGWVPLGKAPGYLTGQELVENPWFGSTFEVIDSMPFDRKRLKSRLKQLGEPIESIKSRGVAVDMTSLRRELGVVGTGSHVVLLYTSSAGHRAVIARRIV